MCMDELSPVELSVSKSIKTPMLYMFNKKESYL